MYRRTLEQINHDDLSGLNTLARLTTPGGGPWVRFPFERAIPPLIFHQGFRLSSTALRRHDRKSLN